VAVTHAAGHTIRGIGQVNGTFVNEGRMEGRSPNDPLQINGTVLGSGVLSDVRINGTHAPGQGPAIVEVEELYGFGPSGRLEIELGGLVPGTGYDQVQASGTVTLDGEVVASLLDDGLGVFQPPSGTRFEILVSESPIGGQFLRAVNGQFGIGTELRLIHEPYRVLLEVLDTFLIGDYDGSGQVEQADLDLVLLNWGQPVLVPPEGWTTDLPEGTIDQSELDRVLLNWGHSTARSATATVPEPSGTILGLLVLSLVLMYSPPEIR
jgi:hypothetical protein